MKTNPHIGNRGVIDGMEQINNNKSKGIEVVRFNKEIEILKMECKAMNFIVSRLAGRN